MSASFDHLPLVREFAAIRRGEHPAWKGDHTLNGEVYAWRLGYDFPIEAEGLAHDLEANESDFSDLTGLPPRSLQIMVNEIRRGAKAALREAKAEGRL